MGPPRRRRAGVRAGPERPGADGDRLVGHGGRSSSRRNTSTMSGTTGRASREGARAVRGSRSPERGFTRYTSKSERRQQVGDHEVWTGPGSTRRRRSPPSVRDGGDARDAGVEDGLALGSASGASSPSTGGWSCSPLAGRQRLVEVTADVVEVLEPDREAHHVGGHARPDERLLVELLVGGRPGWMTRVRRVADVGEVADQLQRLDEALARLAPALTPKVNIAPGPAGR